MCQNEVMSLYLGAVLGANYNFPYANFGRKDSDMYQTRKIGVIGQGHVGAHVANSLLMQGIADELYLCDINETKVTSEVQDLRDSLSFVPYNTKIVNCGDRYEELSCCDIVVNAQARSHSPRPTATASCSTPPTPRVPSPIASSTPGSTASS